MDTQPERFKDFGKRLEVFWDGDSVFYRGTVTAYSTTTRKHTILYDDNDVERVDLKVQLCPTCIRYILKPSPDLLVRLHARFVNGSHSYHGHGSPSLLGRCHTCLKQPNMRCEVFGPQFSLEGFAMHGAPPVCCSL